MTREIKFKVWCKEYEQFIQFNKMGFLEDGSLWYVQGVDEDEKETDPPYFENQNDWELMQYTGLKDSDEKEIYEGDILSFTTEIYYDGVYLETYHIEKVEFDEGSYWAHGHWLTEIIANDYGVKVIGNIYENPELLEREAE